MTPVVRIPVVCQKKMVMAEACCVLPSAQGHDLTADSLHKMSGTTTFKDGKSGY